MPLHRQSSRGRLRDPDAAPASQEAAAGAGAGLVSFLFPGQDAQFPGMGYDLHATSRTVRDVFDEASTALGLDMPQLCFDGPKEILARPAYSRPAVCTLSIAIFRAVLDDTGLRPPDFVCGHSLGEYTADIAAGVLPFGGTLRALREIGGAMEGIRGAMAAVVGPTHPQVLELCRAASGAGLVMPAAFDGPHAVTLSGEVAAVMRAVDLARHRAGTKVEMLAITVPCHSPLMARLEPRLREILEDVRFGPASVPIISNVGAAVHRGGVYARELLVSQFTQPVEWEACVTALLGHGVRTFVELGPRGRLSRLVARQAPGTTAMTARNAASLADVVARLRVLRPALTGDPSPVSGP